MQVFRYFYSIFWIFFGTNEAFYAKTKHLKEIQSIFATPYTYRVNLKLFQIILEISDLENFVIFHFITAYLEYNVNKCKYLLIFIWNLFNDITFLKNILSKLHNRI